MISKLARLLCVALLANAWIGSSSAFAQEHDRSRPDGVKFPLSGSASEIYVAIMGEVKKPGTYHVDPASLKLQTIVKCAGGLTPDATRDIHVVRRQASSFTLVYSDTTDNQLMSGDLLIVDQKQTSNYSSRNIRVAQADAENVRANFEEKAQDAKVQVALLNLLDYPVVLQLTNEESTEDYLNQWLQQPIELMKYKKIITSGTRPTLPPNTVKANSRLNDRSVLVFERGYVDRHRLPANLPRPIESEIALGARGSMIGMPFGQSTELSGVGQQLFSANQSNIDFNRDAFPAVPSVASPRVAPDRASSGSSLQDESIEPVVKSKPRIAVMPSWTGKSRVTNSSSTTTGSVEHQTSEPIPDPDDLKEAPNQSPLIAAPPLTVEEPEVNSSPEHTSIQIWGASIVIGMMLVAALLAYRTFEKNEALYYPHQAESHIPSIPEPIAAQSAQPPAVAIEKPLLDRLIRNELSIEVEPVTFPVDINLQGHVAPAPILRLDGVHSILKEHGPHFSSTNLPVAEPLLQEVVAQAEMPEPNRVRRPHFMAPRVQQDPTVGTDIDNHAGSEAKTNAETSRAPLAKALFQLERGVRP